ncbi:MAG: hypothetical protein MUO52_10245 [Desulfobacterales bacterium]|nr:hypothetical protein [Desulfobacterales bacterium]
MGEGKGGGGKNVELSATFAVPPPLYPLPPREGRPVVGQPSRGDFPTLSTPQPRPYPENILLKHELETLGLLHSIHPLERYQDILKGLNYVRARDLHLHVGKKVTTVGWMVTGKTVLSREGDPMKFVSFEDTTGIYEAVFFPKVYDQCCHMLNGSRPYILKGKVQEDFSAVTLTVHWIAFLDRYNQKKRLLL